MYTNRRISIVALHKLQEGCIGGTVCSCCDSLFWVLPRTTTQTRTESHRIHAWKLENDVPYVRQKRCVCAIHCTSQRYGKIRGTAITTFKYEDMWKLLNEELIDNEFNWLQKRINGHLKEYVFFNRIQECIWWKSWIGTCCDYLHVWCCHSKRHTRILHIWWCDELY